jgi:CubicO group peptidase (beta-lactamase class C family)
MGMPPSFDATQPMLTTADAVLRQAIAERAFPCAAYGVWLRGSVVAMGAAGRFTYAADARLALPDTVFDLASVSKVVATTAMAMWLWERGRLDLEQPIAHWLPEFAVGGDVARRAVTVRMLLTHCSGLPAHARLWEPCATAKELIQACFTMPLEASPGERAVYSDLGFILLGVLLERVAGERIDAFCEREIFRPLGMMQTRFAPPAAWREAIPPTQIDTKLRQRVVQGEVQDENCWRMGGVSGHAGVFGNVPDLLRFAACMLQAGAPLFAASTVELFTRRDVMVAGSSRALGWDTPSVPSSSGQHFSAHSAGHLGYTGTSLWLDFEKNLAITLLTNRTYPGNEPGGISKTIQSVRPRFHDAVFADLNQEGYLL